MLSTSPAAAIVVVFSERMWGECGSGERVCVVTTTGVVVCCGEAVDDGRSDGKPAEAAGLHCWVRLTRVGVVTNGRQDRREKSRAMQADELTD